VPCSSAVLPAGATIANCNSCSSNKGFGYSGSVCYLCSKQLVTTGASTSVCTCANQYMWWASIYGTCICDYSNTVKQITVLTNNVPTCKTCTVTPISNCCLYANNMYFQSTSYSCFSCAEVINAKGTMTNGLCDCQPGYVFNTLVYPV